MDASNNIFTPSPAIQATAAESMLPLYTSGAPPPYYPPSNPAVTPSTHLKLAAVQPVPCKQWTSNWKESFLCIGIAALFFVVVSLIVVTAGGCAVHKQRVDQQVAMKPTNPNSGSDDGMRGTIVGGLNGRSIGDADQMGWI